MSASALFERAHTGTYTLFDKFNPHVDDINDAFEAAMNEFYASRDELEIVSPGDLTFISYVRDAMGGNAPKNIIDDVVRMLHVA